MARLILTFNEQIISEHNLGNSKITIGRRIDNDIVIENIAVSKHHAVIEPKADSFLLTDLGSTNGTFVGKKKISKVELKDNDGIVIGKHIIKFEGNKKSDISSEADFGMKTMVLDTKMQRELLGMQKESGRKKNVTKFARLIISGAGMDKEFTLKKDLITIGKSSDSDIKLKGFFLPKLLATIKRDGESYYLSTCGGFSSVRINGKLAGKNWKLFKNDIIEVRKVKMIFMCN